MVLQRCLGFYISIEPSLLLPIQIRVTHSYFSSKHELIFFLFRYTSIGEIDNTVPNKELWDNERNEYLPAWELKDELKERCGRN